MKTKLLENYLDKELFNIAIGNETSSEISSGNVQKNVIAACHDEKILYRFLEAIAQSISQDPFLFLHEKIGNKVIKYVTKEFNGQDKELIIKNLINPIENTVKEVLSNRKELSQKLIDNSNIKFVEVTKEYENVCKNPEIMERIVKAFEDCSGADIHSERPAFNFVCLDTQQLFISKLPRTQEECVNYLNALLDKNGSLFISCHETVKVQEEGCYDFWKQNSIYKACNLDVLEIKSEILAEASLKKERTPQIIKTTISFENRKDPIIHLHYEGWKNKTPCPNDKLLQILIQEAIRCNPDPQKAIAINCHGGIGRSSAVALAILLFKDITTKLQNKVHPQDISFNIPKMVCDIRKYRESALWSSANQIIPVLGVLSNFYEGLQK